MTYELRYEETAVADLERLPPDVRQRVLQRLEALTRDPRPENSKPLAGDLRGVWSLRVGPYRAGYHIDDKAGVVVVWRVGHRGTFYKRLRH